MSQQKYSNIKLHYIVLFVKKNDCVTENKLYYQHSRLFIKKIFNYYFRLQSPQNELMISKLFRFRCHVFGATKLVLKDERIIQKLIFLNFVFFVGIGIGIGHEIKRYEKSLEF